MSISHTNTLGQEREQTTLMIIFSSSSSLSSPTKFFPSFVSFQVRANFVHSSHLHSRAHSLVALKESPPPPTNSESTS